MSLRRAAVLALVSVLLAPQAFAQDDLFAPLDSEPKAKKSGKKKTTTTGTKKKPGKASTAKKGQAPAEDDLFMPMAPAKKVELVVKLNGDVKGARLFIDGKPSGSLPLTAPLELDEGEYTIVVRRAGFAEFSRRVKLEAGKPGEVPVTLEAVAGVVAVNADVPGASVAIDGQPRGQVPLTGILLKPGSHDFLFTQKGYESTTKTVDVKAGKDYNVVANMKPAPEAVAVVDAPKNPDLDLPDNTLKPGPQVPPLTQDVPAVSESQPWFKRWYVWAGVGAVVTAAAVGTVMATQNGAGPALTREDVCGGPCDGSINGVVRF
jgi:hypothetical protein